MDSLSCETRGWIFTASSRQYTFQIDIKWEGLEKWVGLCILYKAHSFGPKTRITVMSEQLTKEESAPLLNLLKVCSISASSQSPSGVSRLIGQPAKAWYSMPRPLRTPPTS